VSGQHHAPAALRASNKPGTRCTGDWWAQGPVWAGVEKINYLATTRV
jgi:hypothetical protein